jgi:hypothetical protein
MAYKRSDDDGLGTEILISHPTDLTGWTHFCFYRQLQAAYNSSEISLSLVEPTIPETQWQGAAILEDVTATVYIDGQEAGIVDIVAGQAVFEVELQPGEHSIRITAMDCQDAELEVMA